MPAQSTKVPKNKKSQPRGASPKPGAKTAPLPVLATLLDPCEKAHDAEHDRYTDDDGACDEGVN